MYGNIIINSGGWRGRGRGRGRGGERGSGGDRGRGGASTKPPKKFTGSKYQI